MTYEEYEAIKAVRASRLRKMAKSALHYAEEPDKDTPNRGVLRSIHCLALEGEQAWRDAYVVYDGRRDLRTREYSAFVAEHGHKSILNENEYWQVINTVKSLRRHAKAGPILRTATHREETIVWTHPPTGLRCKARIDVRNGCDVADLKTYGTTDPRTISWMATKLFAHVQAAHYCEGVAILLGVPAADITYRLLVAEGKMPFDVAVHVLEHNEALRVGREVREKLMAQLAECEAKNEWPGACPDEVPLVLPEIADPEDDEFIGDEEAA